MGAHALSFLVYNGKLYVKAVIVFARRNLYLQRIQMQIFNFLYTIVFKNRIVRLKVGILFFAL